MSGKVFQVAADDIDTLEWMHAARGYEVKIMGNTGEITKFSGFKDEVSGIVSNIKNNLKKEEAVNR